MENNSIIDILKDEIEKNDMNEDSVLMRNIDKISKQELNILFVGGTGVGKSTTINSLFNTEVAKVGYGVDPETSSIKRYELGNVILWDSPGLGDTPSKDKEYANQIASLLRKRDTNGNLIIDLIVVIIDGSNRDMKTSYEIVENVILPYIDDSKRIIIAINQCDVALKGRYWDYESNLPDENLIKFLDEKVGSIRNRIFDSNGIYTEPIYYSAIYKYNVSKLLLKMIQNMPLEKRFLFSDSLNKNPEVWKKNDYVENYNLEIQREVSGSINAALNAAAKGAVAGATIGSLIPIIGPVIGASVGAVLGFLDGVK